MPTNAQNSGRVWVAPIVLSAVFLTPLGVAGTAIAVPAIAESLGSNSVGLQWVINAFNVSFALSTLASGIFADRFGNRLTFVLGLAFVLASSAVSFCAPTLLVLDIGRSLAGVGGGAIIAGGAAIIASTFPSGAARSRAFASFGMSIGLGLALGPSISGALISVVGWRDVYAVLGVTVFGILIATAALPRSRRRYDSAHKSVDFSLLRNRRFLAYSLVALAPAVGFVTMLSYLPVTLAALFGKSAGESGLILLPLTIPVLVGPIIAAQLVQRVRWISTMTMIYVSITLLILGDLGLTLLPLIPLVWLCLPLVLVGLGYGFPLGLVDAAAISAVPERSSGTAAGILNFFRTGSAALTVAVYGLAISTLIGASLSPNEAARVSSGGFGHGDIYAASFQTVLLMMVVAIVIIGIVIWWLDHSAERQART